MKSKPSYYFIILLLLLFPKGKSSAQTPDWKWAKSMGGNNNGRGISIIVGHSGNIYTAGYFKDTVNFDPGPATSFLVSSGNEDIFISKSDPSGKLIWAKSFGGPGFDAGFSLTLDDSENVYTTGGFQDSADFDPGPGIFMLSGSSASNIFISEIDSMGNFILAKTMSSATSVSLCNFIKRDIHGNFYLTGNFSGTVDFDPDTGIFNLSSNQTYNTFILKLDNQCHFSWVKAINGSFDNSGYAVEADALGNVYASGLFIDDADLDPGPGTYNVITAGWSDIYVLKLDSLGNFLWGFATGGSDFDGAYSLALSPSENELYITGLFQDVVDFDPGPGIFNLSSPVSQNTFILKLDSDGNFNWAKAIIGLNTSSGSIYMAIDSAGDIYNSGFFAGSTDFDPGPSSYILPNTGMNDIFILKLNSSGNFQWVKTAGGKSDDYGYGIAVNGVDEVLITGFFSSDTLVFDADTLINTSPVGNSSEDIFIARISCSSYISINLSSCISYTSPSGNYTWYSSGNYSDTLTNTAGCDSIITINLIINTVDTAVLQNGFTLNANASGALYQWLDCNNGYAAINGQTGQSFTATANGNYAVSVTQNGCTDTSACYSVTGVGIDEISTGSNFEILPNPATDQCSIIINEKMKQSLLSIYDVAGKPVWESEINQEKTTINTNEFSPGIYLVQLLTGNIIETKRLAIVR
jgi:hypothetical protein